MRLTQRYLLSGVGRQQKHQQRKGGDEDAWNQEIEPVVQRPPPHDHGEGDVRVRLLTAVVELLIPPAWNLYNTHTHRSEHPGNHIATPHQPPITS